MKFESSLNPSGRKHSIEDIEREEATYATSGAINEFLARLGLHNRVPDGLDPERILGAVNKLSSNDRDSLLEYADQLGEFLNSFNGIVLDQRQEEACLDDFITIQQWANKIEKALVSKSNMDVRLIDEIQEELSKSVKGDVKFRRTILPVSALPSDNGLENTTYVYLFGRKKGRGDMGMAA